MNNRFRLHNQAITNISCLLVILTLTACSHSNSRYQQRYDSTPERLPTASELVDATPRPESYSRGGNKNYQVRGKHYHVLPTAKGFTETGIASWYGRKFHGHLTSNGEVYDMYAMSAAHKHLPLPSYVKVTNNNNGRSVIVRVNDRGPFHQSRIIDLSYSAAYKLDMLKTGTAKVTITAITDFNNPPITNEQVTPLAKPVTITAAQESLSVAPIIKESSETLPAGHYIQLFASSSSQKATQVITTIKQQYNLLAKSQENNGIFRVLIGPIMNEEKLQQQLLTLKQNGYPNAFIKKQR